MYEIQIVNIVNINEILEKRLGQTIDMVERTILNNLCILCFVYRIFYFWRWVITNTLTSTFYQYFYFF